jgi:hypothetical protein
MTPAKVKKLTDNVAKLTAECRQAAVRLKGMSEVAAECDVEPGPQRDALVGVCDAAAGIVQLADTVNASIPGLAKALVDAPKPQPAK